MPHTGAYRPAALPAEAGVHRIPSALPPPVVLIAGAVRRKGKSASRMDARQKAATSDRAMEPACPLMTRTCPFGDARGRTHTTPDKGHWFQHHA